MAPPDIGFRVLAKLGIDRTYVMIKTFLYSVYGQQGGERHQGALAIAAYRNHWLDALLIEQQVEAVIALGTLADRAWQAWKATQAGRQSQGAYAHVTHPTQPESSSGDDRQKHQSATSTLLQNWNAALDTLKPVLAHPDEQRPFDAYGEVFVPADLVAIPAADLPAGSPAWMRSPEHWAVRTGSTAQARRFTITISVPASFQRS